MKIVHVTTGLFPGGAEHTLERLIYADRENEHHVISLHEESVIGSRLRNNGVAVDALHFTPGRVPGPLAMIRLWQLIRKSRPDVVQSWMYHSNLLAGVVAKAAGARSICWNIRRRGFDSSAVGRSTKFVARLGGWMSYFIPDYVIYCAESAASWHIAFGYDKRNAYVIHNGVDTDNFSINPSSGSAFRKKLNIEEKSIVVGSVARFDPDKDHATLLIAIKRALRSFPELKCLLIGRGADPTGRLADFAASLGISDHVLMLGHRTDLPAIMNSLDLHVTSSVTEGFPNVIAEAMACGTPCVSTDVGDARLVIGKHGWMVPIKSPNALGDAIVEAISLRGTPEWSSRRESGRAYCKANFGIAKMVAAYQGIWTAAARRSSTT